MALVPAATLRICAGTWPALFVCMPQWAALTSTLRSFQLLRECDISPGKFPTTPALACIGCEQRIVL